MTVEEILIAAGDAAHDCGVTLSFDRHSYYAVTPDDLVASPPEVMLMLGYHDRMVGLMVPVATATPEQVAQRVNHAAGLLRWGNANREMVPWA